jgi:hypothetical protein
MHVIVEHSVGHFRPNEISSADESHAVQPLTSTNTQNPLALRRLLDFAVRVPKSVSGGSYGEPDCPNVCAGVFPQAVRLAGRSLVALLSGTGHRR